PPARAQLLTGRLEPMLPRWRRPAARPPSLAPRPLGLPAQEGDIPALDRVGAGLGGAPDAGGDLRLGAAGGGGRVAPSSARAPASITPSPVRDAPVPGADNPHREDL